MPFPLSPVPASLGARFTTGEALRSGVSPHRLRAHDLARPFRGVYSRADLLHSGSETLHPSERWRLRQRLLAAAFSVAMVPDAFFTGRTAAAIWHLPIPAASHDDLEVAVFAPHRAVRRSGIRGSQVRAHLVELTEVGGMPVITPASVWAVLAPVLGLRDRVALGDAVLHRQRIGGTKRVARQPYATLHDLERLVQAGPRPGVHVLRATLPLLTDRAASAPESHLRLCLSQWGFPAPELDFDVYSSSGVFLGCSEFAFPEFRVVLEYEGIHHLVNPDQWNRDIEKYHDYASAGWIVVRVTATLLYREPDMLRSRIAEALARGGWQA